MKLRLVPTVSGAALLIRAALCQATETTALTDSQQVFVQRYVQAIQAQDFEAHKRAIHPKCRACYTKDNEDFHREMFRRRTWPPEWPAVKATRAQIFDTPPSEKDLAEALPGCPARPTHVLQLDFSAGEFKSKSVLVHIAMENGSWYEVFGCPTPELLKAFRAAKKEREAEIARATALVSSVKEPLLSELRALLREGQKVSAIRRYRDASGADLSTAKRVVELLESRP